MADTSEFDLSSLNTSEMDFSGLDGGESTSAEGASEEGTSTASETMDINQLAGDVLNAIGEGSKAGVILTSEESLGVDNQNPTYIRITLDSIEILVEGKTGFVINKDGVKQSGSTADNSLPSDKNGSMWNENILKMSFLPSTIVTPIPDMQVKNPFSDITKIISAFGGGG